MTYVVNPRQTPVYLSDGSVVAGGTGRDAPDDETTRGLVADGLLVVTKKPPARARRPRRARP